MISTPSRPSIGRSGERPATRESPTNWSRSSCRLEPRSRARVAIASALRKALRFGKRALPSLLTGWFSEIEDGRPPIGAVRFGDFAGATPIDANFGFGRGTPIDRFYIESFLDRHRNDIAGRVLEVADSTYSRRFGAERVTRQDVLHIRSGNPNATIVGDLSKPDVLPRDSFDCIVLTQTLQFIYDLRPAIAQLHASLKPGGVLLATVPGISQIDPAEDWGGTWCWTFSSASMLTLFAEVFDAGSISVESHGNVFAAVSFLHGLALEELPRSNLLAQDPNYPVIVTLRARRRS
jgi:SAM-dependent methyltransferase